MRKIFILFISVVLALSTVVSAESNELDIVSLGAILMDYETGRVLYGKDEHEALAMASTTKIMTAIIAIEDGNLNDMVTVSKRASQAPKVKMYLQEGEQIKLEYLLYALMLESSNDAAIAIAEHVHGSVEEFCEVMTEKAHELGAVNTTFETPNGLDSQNPNHMSTAYDMALITKYALDNAKVVEVMNTKSITFESDTKSYGFTNKNKLLSTYAGANGGKTGYTNKAGQCFVGTAKRDNMQLISVVLGSGWGESGKEQKWIDTKILLNYGFENYKYYKVLDGEKKVGDVMVLDSKVESLPVYINGEIVVPMTEEEANGVKFVPKYSTEIQAPFLAGQVVGKLEVNVGDEVVGIVDIYTKDGAELNTFEYNFRKVLGYWLKFGVR